MCDTAPAVPMSVSTPSAQVVSATVLPLVPQELGREDGATVLAHVHEILFQQYQWLWTRYEKIFSTRDGITRPICCISQGSLLATDVPMEIVHQFFVSVLEGIQIDVGALPSTSSGQVD